METYIFLSPQDKKKLITLAESKQLSFSTTCGIIIKYLHPLVTTMYGNKYITKGEKQVHIKIRNTEHYEINSITSTNCIYCYLNRPTYQGKKINWQNKYIQSELDRTEDPNRNKNIEIRIAYRVRNNAL